MDSFEMFTTVHVADGSADGDGADTEASKHFAKVQPFIVSARTVYSSLEQTQKQNHIQKYTFFKDLL